MEEKMLRSCAAENGAPHKYGWKVFEPINVYTTGQKIGSFTYTGEMYDFTEINGNKIWRKYVLSKNKRFYTLDFFSSDDLKTVLDYAKTEDASYED